ncbi:MAG: acyl carrier protein [Firmicutes bacterium]|nr:acyl carrier protein [Bacillota bacterium]
MNLYSRLEDRVIEIISSFSGALEETITPGDNVRQEDGGWLEDDELSALVDELEGEFGITIDTYALADIEKVDELIDMVQELVMEKIAGDKDLI